MSYKGGILIYRCTCYGDVSIGHAAIWLYGIILDKSGEGVYIRGGGKDGHSNLHKPRNLTT